MATTFAVSLASAVLSLLPRVFGDIPVHCTQFQILGAWRFHVGQWKDGDPLCGGAHPDVADGHHDLTPPVRDPSKKEAGGYWLSNDFREIFTMDAVLKDWTVTVENISAAGLAFHPGAPSSMPKGMWTMVYNEGFNMHMEADKNDPNFHSMFAFSKFTLRPGADSASTDNVVNRQNSHCGYTLLGWYKIHEKGTLGIKKHLCYWGERLEPLYPALLKKHESKMPPQGILVRTNRGTPDTEQPDSADTQGAALPSKGSGGILLGSKSVGLGDSKEKCPGGICDEGTTQAASKGPIILDLQAARQRLHNISIGTYAEMSQKRLQDATNKGTIVRYESDPEKIKQFAQSSAFGTPYKEPSTVQELLNRWSPPPTIGLPALPGFSSEQIIGPVRQRAIMEQEQVAKEHGYASTKDLSLEDMREHWGPRGHNHQEAREFFLDGQRLGPDEWRDRASFDWRRVSLVLGSNSLGNKTVTGFVAPVPDQGNCGSCYAVASTSMLTARLMLRYPERYHQRFMDGDRVSWHQQLDCNQYVQGCDGGYPLLVSRWSMENDVVLKSCANAVGRHSDCSYSAPECQEDRFRVRHFRYVGGSFGRCGSKRLCEAALREELYKGGPMVVSLEPTDDFSAFTGGVLHKIQILPESNSESAPADDKNCTETECYTWRKIDHSMLLVGWGEDNRYGKYCMPLPDEEASMEEKCKLHKDSEEKCKAAGCHYGGFPYWIIQNSWTNTWGVDGYLLLGPRGQNPLMVEMMSVSADIVRAEELGNYFSLAADKVDSRRQASGALFESSMSARSVEANLSVAPEKSNRAVRVRHHGFLEQERRHSARHD